MDTDAEDFTLQRPLELVANCEGRRLARVSLRRRRYAIGHDRGNEISLDDPSISKRHAVLEVLSEDEMYLEDLGSANGTYVDGQLCETPLRVELDSLVQIGNSALVFERHGLPASVFRRTPAGFLNPQRYDWGDALVRGGISIIHEAHEHSLNRPVAIRVMQPASQRSARTVLRFVREAQIMGQLQHPQIPPVYEMRVGDEGQLYYTTRAIEGDPLSVIIDRLRAGDAAAQAQWTLPALIGVFQKAADAIAYAHSCGVMHRAVRPENIIAGDFGEVLVLGWTWARLYYEGLDPSPRQVFAAGEPIHPGLSPYTAPELACGTGIYDERVDIYGLGAVLYSLLSLALPFAAEANDARLVDQIVSVGIPPLRTPGTPHPELERVVMKSVATSPEQRPRTVRELQAELAACDLSANTAKKWGWGGLLGR